MCDYSNDCLDNSDEQPERCFEYTCRCDMEDASTCHWDQDIDDDTDWVIMRAASDDEGLMPTTDHTLGTGQGKQNLSYSCCHLCVQYQLCVWGSIHVEVVKMLKWRDSRNSTTICHFC